MPLVFDVKYPLLKKIFNILSSGSCNGDVITIFPKGLEFEEKKQVRVTFQLEIINWSMS